MATPKNYKKIDSQFPPCQGRVREGLIIVLFFLFSLKPAFAASFNINPSSGSLKKNCQTSASIIINTDNTSTNAADIIVDYDPNQIEIIDSSSNQSGIQIKTGSVFSDYAGNVVDSKNGTIKLTGFSSSSPFYGSGVFATIQFKPKTNSNNGYFSIRFTGTNPSNTLDSNIADATTNNDNLSSVTNASYAFTTGSCTTDITPPIINFISPINNQQSVLSTANIVISISDKSSGVDPNSIQIIINGITYLSSNSQVNINGNTYTIQPIDPLFANQTNNVVVKVSDFSGNSKQNSITFNNPSVSACPAINTANCLANNACPNQISPTISNTPENPITNGSKDNKSPIIDFISPKNNSQISLTPTFTINVADIESGIDPDTFKINLNGEIFNRNSPNLSLTPNANGYTATLKIDQKLTPDTQYTLTAFVADKNNNGLSLSINLHTKKLFSFFTSLFFIIPATVSLIGLIIFFFRRLFH